MNNEESIWVTTEPSLEAHRTQPGGTEYVVSVQFNADSSIVLSREEAPEYAYAILGWVAQAEYDAAVLRQMETRVSKEVVVQLILDLRALRSPIASGVTGPLALTPGVNQNGEAFLDVVIDGERVGQWSPQDARSHAISVLESQVVAGLDADYLEVLCAKVQVSEITGRSCVQDLANYRT